MSIKGQGYPLTFPKFIGFSNLNLPPPPQTVETKYHVKDFGITEMKIYINGLGHMTKMVAMPIYGKKSLKTFSSESVGGL